MFWLAGLLVLVGLGCANRTDVAVTIDASPGARAQTIDGFGTCVGSRDAFEPYFSELLFGDLGASILRFDVTPRFKPPYADFEYGSPGAPGDPDLPGPEANNARTYRDAASYIAPWAGRVSQIAVMGPDIDRNLAYFDYHDPRPRAAGLLAQQAELRKRELGDFKLIASLWSPAPWLKLASGRAVHGTSDPRPREGTPWPFIWKGNFAGGVLDTSGVPRAQFDDTALGGSGPTSALSQFARGLAAYVRGFQRTYGVRLYALSIQNEPAFEEYYDSCAYPRASGYVAAVESVRAELDRYDDLRSIRLFGPEDVIGGSVYGLWQGDRGTETTARNLGFLQDTAPGHGAGRVLDFFAVHGYAANGVAPGRTSPTLWDTWWNGWRAAPERGLPSSVQGVAVYGKKSWMTETSGEQPPWRAPSSGFPDRGAFSIAVKLHHALTAGRQSAWLYWQLVQGDAVDAEQLTDRSLRASSPKYAAVKHFFRFIRPGAVRVRAEVRSDDMLLASAYVHDADRALTIVLINTAERPVTTTVRLPPSSSIAALDAYTSKDGSYFQHARSVVAAAALKVTVPGYGVITLHGQAAR